MKSTRGIIAIAGAGRMGRGIALTFAYQGYRVDLIDVKERGENEFQQLKLAAFTEMESQLHLLAAANVFPKESVSSLLDQISIGSIQDQMDILQGADVLFEAVPEILEVKEKVFARLCPLFPENMLIASTTSSFSVNHLAGFVAERGRFMNTHWLNPAYLIPLVEVSPGDETSEEALQAMFQLLEGVGKVPVMCAPSPGFIVPRIQALAMNEAARLAEEGVASIGDIDKASRIGFGLRFAVLGLLEFIDWGGADTLFHASHYLRNSLKQDRFAPPKIIENKMETGDIGMKAQRGFYSFDDQNVDEYQIETLRKFIDLLQHLGFIASPKEASLTVRGEGIKKH
ncbi:3-hydroxybutyryl-CoA dehydrogenase [Bacillus sp. PK3_68]|uniref:3-hydroxybutyryl-CoA dehydrogenase n=1 Tax=Bacillus sp. PK3_68 TaxID=2027408 RepID=UPI000E73FC1C|nr:3-hydroxybutyryl-CoA dehydrogenase [Bacillus sp. PK3_68]RJS61915.1 3-hydroxybutyryl-CoA dehydrogenase [Bacillus sp. PK3_68]